MSIINYFFPSYFFPPIDPKKRLENAEFFIKKEGFNFQKNYGMETQQEHVKLLERVITLKSFKSVLEINNYINKHHIFNNMELALFIAKEDPLLLIENIDILQISEESDRYKLIELLIKNIPKLKLPQLIININKFNFASLSNYINIIDSLIHVNGIKCTIISIIMSFNRLGINSDENRYHVYEYLANLSPKTVASLLKFITMNNPIYMKNLVTLLIKQAPKELLEHFDSHQNQHYRHNIAKMLLSDVKNENLNQEDSSSRKITNSLITQIEKYRNKDLQTFLIIYFLTNSYASTNYLKTFELLTSGKKGEPIQHLLLPMIILSSLGDLNEDLSIIQTITKFLSSREVRKSLRSSTGFMQNLLQTLHVMEKNSTWVPNSKKLYSIQAAFNASNSLENRCKQYLDILSVMFFRPDIYEAIVDKLPKNYSFEELLIEFNKQLPDMLYLENPIDNFWDKYNNFENKMRVPCSLIKYVTKLTSLQDSRLSIDIQRLVRSILENKVEEERYLIHDNPHLQFIQENFSSVFTKWKVSLEPKEITIDIKKQLIAVDTDQMQDLLLCGTEIDGSCQRIDGNPETTKGLIAYILDGKNRMLAIKNKQSGKIQARCLLKILLDNDTQKPVLFQERIYPTASEYTNLLNDLAENKAKDLNLSLYTLDTNNRNLNMQIRKKIISLKNSLAYEYVDGMRGMITNGEVTISAYKVI